MRERAEAVKAKRNPTKHFPSSFPDFKENVNSQEKSVKKMGIKGERECCSWEREREREREKDMEKEWAEQTAEAAVEAAAASDVEKAYKRNSNG